MKKYIRALSLILALSLCLSMAACSSDDKAFKEADALLAAGDYDGAIAAFSAIGRYEEISAKIAEAEKLRNNTNMGFLFGTWKDLNYGYVYTFNEDGTGIITYPEDLDIPPTDFDYMYSDGQVEFVGGMHLTVCEIDGVTHLIYANNEVNLVPEADYPTLASYAVEITLENWQDYFEMKEVNSISVNAFGEVSSVQPSIGIFLKEEYYSRLPNNYWDIDISFELTYDEAAYKVLNCTPDEFDYNFIGNYEIEPVDPPRWWELETGCTVIATVYDQRNGTYLSEQSPYINTVSAEMGMWGGGASDGNTQYTTRWTNVQVSRVIGTLKLFPA